MARQTTLHFAGMQGNLIYYRRLGGYYIRSRPATCRQTSATKNRSTNFGIAARAAKALRSELLPVLPFPKDKNMQNRFTAAIAKWLQQEAADQIPAAARLPYIEGFQFNDSTSLAERCSIPFTATAEPGDHIALHIPGFVPAQAFAAPAQTLSVECVITVAGCALKDGIATGGYTTRLSFAYNDQWQAPQTLQLPIALQRGNLVVVTIALEYYLIKKEGIHKNINVTFMPAGVVGSWWV